MRYVTSFGGLYRLTEKKYTELCQMIVAGDYPYPPSLGEYIGDIDIDVSDIDESAKDKAATHLTQKAKGK